MRTSLAVLTAALALAGGVAACSTSSSNSSSQSTATPASAAKSGTETIYGKITGAAANVNSPTFPLTFTGPVNSTGNIPLGAAPAKGAAHTLNSKEGKLTIVLDSAGTNSGGLVSTKTCLASFTTTVPFTVDGAKSTGKFAGASGTGNAVVVFSGDLPKQSNGQCNQSQSAAPSDQTAAATFSTKFPLTLKG